MTATPKEIRQALYGRKRGRIQVSPPEERTMDNIVFHSKLEMGHYCQFRALARSGAIEKLELQVSFDLFACRLDTCDPVKIGRYVADFVVTEKDGTKRIYDSKGMTTEVYAVKKKLFHACYPNLRIVELYA